MSKIIVKNVELKNFFSYGNTWTEFDFEQGLNVILGHDKDKDRSNGAGKTSFLEAIPYALFGQTSKGVSQDKIINWVNGKQCEVRLTFEKAGVPYTIHRGIKPGILELYEDGQAVPKLSDKRVFQAELEQDLIGMDYKAAQSLLFQNANNMVSMFNAKRAEKRQFVEKLFNLELYSKMHEEINRKLRGLDVKFVAISSEVDFSLRRIQELAHEIEMTNAPDMTAYRGNFERSEREIAEFRDQNAEMVAFDIQAANSELAERELTLSCYTNNLSESEAQKNTLELDIRGLKSDIERYARGIERIGDISQQKEKLDALRAGLVKLSSIPEKLQTQKAQYEELTATQRELTSSVAQLSAEITGLEAQKRKWENQDVDSDMVECPTCFQDVDASCIEDHIAGLIKEIDDKLTPLREEFNPKNQQHKDIVGEITAIRAEMKQTEEFLERKIQIERKIAEYSNIEEKEIELKSLNVDRFEANQNILEMEDNLVGVTDVLYKAKLSYDNVINDIRALKENITRYDQYHRESDNLQNKLSLAKSTMDSQQDLHDRIQDELSIKIASKEQLRLEITTKQAEKKRYEEFKDILEYLRETLKDENVKQYAISNLVPYINRQMNHYLGETGHNYYVKLDSWLEGEILGPGVGDCDFGNMSGGEAKSIDLAMKFAMMDVARLQAGSYIDILVLDELLDSSIDSFGLEKLMDIVKLKQKEDNLKVYIVSHREEIGDFGVDNIYKVTKRDGFSYIEGSA